ncbi:Uma2 family endonuclease [Spirosoma endbachense]|uniref:Uma2 family endonuclease n=1 Tax=Spirosoma endbachense TaxID=2666025 RepID=A0A6P1VRR0_9BACT|nr:Uma2 family endonuclease [Spirosoma endbachense]QHV94792.1 Uma2 family endonuclease [Spirosoma endbachense]
MESAVKIQLSDKQIARLEAGGVIAIQASWDDFMEFLQETRYRADYHNGRIIIMGLAAFFHEVLIMTVGDILRHLLKGKGYFVAGSNVGVLKEAGKGYYNPDITIVKGMPVFHTDSTAIITNPYFVVDILSESTAAYDFNHKLRKYQGIGGLQEVIFIDRFDVSVTVFRRTDTVNTWTETIYEKTGDVVRIAGDNTVLLQEFFADLPGEALGEQAIQ